MSGLVSRSVSRWDGLPYCTVRCDFHADLLDVLVNPLRDLFLIGTAFLILTSEYTL